MRGCVRRRPARLLLGVLAAALLPLSGCIVVKMGSPPPWAGSSATATPQPASSRTKKPGGLVAFLVKGGRLVAVPRSGSSAGTSPEEAVRVLLAGPTGAERAAGITSAVPAGTRLNNADVDFYKTARVDVSREFAAGGAKASAKLRIAQIVYTVTQLPGITAVQFYIDGKKAQSLGSERIDLMQPKSRADFPLSTP